MSFVSVFSLAFFALVVALSRLCFQAGILNSHQYASFFDWLVGYKGSAVLGSDRRRGMSRIALMYSIMFACLVASEQFTGQPASQGSGVLIILVSLLQSFVALVLFYIVVISIPFKNSPDFPVNWTRLAVDTLISAFAIIFSFAVFYNTLGLDGGFEENNCTPGNVTFTETVYFSAVTFSTLGYGDFAACGGSRLLAAVQALIGNIHLGVFVGCVFNSARTTR